MFVAFGEIMMRVTPEGFLRFRQAIPGTLEVTFGGGEANVCASLATFGAPTRYVTALPTHALADSCVADLRSLGVDTSHILRRDDGRLGIYFLETGANQRSSNVIYDRAGSAVSLAGPDEYDWDAALDGAGGVHVTGITPSLSEPAYLATRKLVELADAKGIGVSCDLNYRKKLWNWRPGTSKQDLAAECMGAILPHVETVIGNEEDAEKVLGISAAGTAVEKGQINAAAYESVARTIVERFGNVRRVAITLRESISASHNNWGAMLFDVATDRPYFAPLDDEGNYRPYEIRDIVDRVGGGDSFAAGLLFALSNDATAEPASAIAHAVAASCLKHSIKGDFNYVSWSEVTALAGGDASGRVKR